MKLFMPTDRIGLSSIQRSIPGNFKAINELINRKNNSYPIEVQWHTDGIYFKRTTLWPEGHYYQSGFSVEDSVAARETFDKYKIKYEEVSDVPATGKFPRSISIAFYSGFGSVKEFSAPLIEVLNWGGFAFEYLNDEDIRSGKLDDFDVLVVPGSPDAGECYYAGLGDKGFDKIRSFIANRGNYIGVCGGAYLPLTSYSTRNRYWLNVVEATETEDLDYWRSGSGFVKCRIEDDHHPVFSAIALGASTTLNMVYWEGPSITLKGDNVKSLARFEQLVASGRNESLRPSWDIGDNQIAIDAINYYNPLSVDIFNNLLKGKTSIAEANFKGHKILLFSPHPEMGNIGCGPRMESLNFLLMYNGLMYLAAIR